MALRVQAEWIVLRCPNWIGDAVVSTAAVRCIRRNYPKARLALLMRPYVRGVYENNPWSDEIIETEPEAGAWAEVRGGARRLRKAGGFDLGVLLTASFSSALMLRMGRVRRRVGHARNGRSWLLTDAVPWPAQGRQADLVSKVRLYTSLMEYLGCEGAADEKPEVFTSPSDERAADEALSRHGCDPSQRLLAVVPGAAYGASKLWDPERFGQVSDVLARKRGLRPLLLTGPGEAEIARDIARSMEETPVTFGEGEIAFGVLKALIRRSALMICNDTGPRHIAIAYDVPTVVLMGPTSPLVTDSDYDRAIIVQQDVPCGPCYLRQCPSDHRCMKLIKPEMVLAAAEELLEKFPK